MPPDKSPPRLTVRLDADLRRKVELLALALDSTMQDIVIEALNQYISEQVPKHADRIEELREAMLQLGGEADRLDEAATNGS